MPIRRRALAFSESEFQTPMQVLEALHNRVAQTVGLNVLGTWPKLFNPMDLNAYKHGETLFMHPSSQAFSREYWKGIRTHFPTPLQRMAWRGGPAFTFIECMKEMQPIGRDRWVFDLFVKCGVRDGLYCFVNGWMFVYWSTKRVVLSELDRHALNFAAGMAVAKIVKIMASTRRKRPKGNPQPKLTRREYDVITGLSNGQRAAEIASNLGIATATVRNHIVLAQAKLGARTATQAVVEAYRRALVK